MLFHFDRIDHLAIYAIASAKGNVGQASIKTSDPQRLPPQSLAKFKTMVRSHRSPKGAS